MNGVRKTLGVLFAFLGTYYCARAALTLAALPGVTAEWVRRSGDPDFRYDTAMFEVWIGVGAVLGAAFGWRTVVKGIRAARGARESWLALAIGAPMLHWFWFLYRTIGNGLLNRAARADAMRHDALWFGAVTLAYVVMCALMPLFPRRGRRGVPSAATTG